MKVLVLCEYPPLPAGLSTQADLFVRGLQAQGVDVQAVHWDSMHEKEWYYRWFAPDVVVGVGYWGYAADIILHPQQYKLLAVPWLVADGYIASYRDELNALPLLLVTSSWVREVYERDGITSGNIAVLPVGCDTKLFVPRLQTEAKVRAVRESLGVKPDELLLLTVGGDAASKGAQEVMQALALIKDQVPKWKYICKVWPQERTNIQNQYDQEIIQKLGLSEHISYSIGRLSRNFMPYLYAACDIYAGPSRLEGFGMPHIEAGACGKPVIAINAMAFKDTLVHGKTAFLAGVAQVNYAHETVLGEHAGKHAGQHIRLDPPRVADYRADVNDIANGLRQLMQNAELRHHMGEAGRQYVVTHFDYHTVAQQFIDILIHKLPQISLPMTEDLRTPVGTRGVPTDTID